MKQDKEKMRMLLAAFLMCGQTSHSGLATAHEIGTYTSQWMERVWNPLMYNNYVRASVRGEVPGWKVTPAGLKFLENKDG